MQIFKPNLSKLISLEEQKWAGEPAPQVDFSLDGDTLTATVPSGPRTSWPKDDFCKFLQIVVHKVDQSCDVTACEQAATF